MDNFKPLQEEASAGIVAHDFLPHFANAIRKNKAYQDFIRHFASAKKWYLVSDYCFDANEKPNDCACFTIIPHIIPGDLLLTGLNEASGADIKSVRQVNPKFIAALEKLPLFNVSIVLNRKRRMFTDERRYFQAKIETTIRQLSVWDEATPEGRGFTSPFRTRLKRLEQVLKSSNANLKVIRDIDIVSSMAAYLAFTVSARKGEMVTWFSDRDSMLSFMNDDEPSTLAFDLAYALHHVLCSSSGENMTGQFAFAVPESSGPVFYDPLVRIPDLICGALADYNLSTGKTSHVKFTPVLQELFTCSDRNAFYRLELTKAGVGLSEIQFIRSPFKDAT